MPERRLEQARARLRSTPGDPHALGELLLLLDRQGSPEADLGEVLELLLPGSADPQEALARLFRALDQTRPDTLPGPEPRALQESRLRSLATLARDLGLVAGTPLPREPSPREDGPSPTPSGPAPLPAPLVDATFGGDGSRLLTLDGAGVLRVWSWPAAELLGEHTTIPPGIRLGSLDRSLPRAGGGRSWNERVEDHRPSMALPGPPGDPIPALRDQSPDGAAWLLETEPGELRVLRSPFSWSSTTRTLSVPSPLWLARLAPSLGSVWTASPGPEAWLVQEHPLESGAPPTSWEVPAPLPRDPGSPRRGAVELHPWGRVPLILLGGGAWFLRPGGAIGPLVPPESDVVEVAAGRPRGPRNLFYLARLRSGRVVELISSAVEGGVRQVAVHRRWELPRPVSRLLVAPSNEALLVTQGGMLQVLDPEPL